MATTKFKRSPTAMTSINLPDAKASMSKGIVLMVRAVSLLMWVENILILGDMRLSKTFCSSRRGLKQWSNLICMPSLMFVLVKGLNVCLFLKSWFALILMERKATAKKTQEFLKCAKRKKNETSVVKLKKWINETETSSLISYQIFVKH